MRTFKHSGDMGDIIFSLPAMRALGGGVLLLDPDGGATEPAVISTTPGRTRLTKDRIDQLRPLLLQQEYISDVNYWQGETADINLDDFRHHLKEGNLADAHLLAFGLPRTERDRAWLTVPDPLEIPDRPLVINRTVRHQSNHAFWEAALPLMKDRCIFVGLPKEHEIFEYAFECKIPYHSTESIIDLARVIAGCKQFLGNASFAHAVAEGMKKRMIVEISRIVCNVKFDREGAEYV